MVHHFFDIAYDDDGYLPVVWKKTCDSFVHLRFLSAGWCCIGRGIFEPRVLVAALRVRVCHSEPFFLHQAFRLQRLMTLLLLSSRTSGTERFRLFYDQC